jgi:amino acid transporter
VLLVLRRSQPELKRPFRLWGAKILAPIAFICSNWIIYWTGFKTNSFLFILVGVGFVLYALNYYLIARRPAGGWRHIA